MQSTWVSLPSYKATWTWMERKWRTGEAYTGLAGGEGRGADRSRAKAASSVLESTVSSQALSVMHQVWPSREPEFPLGWTRGLIKQGQQKRRSDFAAGIWQDLRVRRICSVLHSQGTQVGCSCTLDLE
jgi:hypothetical protein